MRSLWLYQCRVLRVVDGDTVDLEVDLWPQRVVGEQIDLGFNVHCTVWDSTMHYRDRFRLSGIDAWEVRGPERERGLVASEALRRWTREHDVWVRTARDTERGKYGRWLAELIDGRHPDGETANEFLVAGGHAQTKTY